MKTVPADGAVLPVPPPSIALTFNEPVSPLVLRLLGPDGKSVDLGNPEVRDDTLTVPLSLQLARGSYLFSWRIASADGHPVGGTISFAVGAPSSRVVAPAPAHRAAGLDAAIALTGLTLLAGLLFGIGGVAFDAWISQYDPGSCRRHLPALLLAFVAAPVSLGLQGLDALAAPWVALLSRPCWTAAMSTTYGTSAWLAEAAALVGLFACASGSASWRRVLALVSLFLLGLALASSGHAATATTGSAAPATVFLHVVAVAGWLGALFCLPFLLLAGYGETALRRFSAVAVAIVIMLVATGMLLAWWQLRAPHDLWRTAYGRILAVKLILVLGLLALGARNRWRWTGPVLRDDAVALRALVRNIRWELVLAVAVLCAVVLWRFTPPPRALPQDRAMSMMRAMSADHAASMDHPASMDHAASMGHSMSGNRTAPPTQAVPLPPSTLQLHGGGANARAIVAPQPGGHASVTIAITRGDGKPLQAKEVSVRFYNAQMGIEGIVRSGHPLNGGEPADTWIIDDVPLLVSGSWGIKADALVSDFDSLSLQGHGNINLESAAPR